MRCGFRPHGLDVGLGIGLGGAALRTQGCLLYLVALLHLPSLDLLS
jgi:hypothetical protein